MRKLQKRVIIRISLVLLMVLVFCPVTVNAAPRSKVYFLLRFFDMNEEGFAYHRHCVSTTEAINAKFLKTLEVVANELFAESKKENPKTSPKHIKNQILSRRDKIQYNLDLANMKDGCYSQASLRAKEHYQEFSHYNKAAILKFINEKTQG